MATNVMDFNREDPVRETCLELGKKFGWFNVPLADKIEAVSLKSCVVCADNLQRFKM